MKGPPQENGGGELRVGLPTGRLRGDSRAGVELGYDAAAANSSTEAPFGRAGLKERRRLQSEQERRGCE